MDESGASSISQSKEEACKGHQRGGVREHTRVHKRPPSSHIRTTLATKPSDIELQAKCKKRHADRNQWLSEIGWQTLATVPTTHGHPVLSEVNSPLPSEVNSPLPKEGEVAPLSPPKKHKKDKEDRRG